MWYLFDKDNKCYGTTNIEPDKDDLAERNESAVESDILYANIEKLMSKDGVIEESSLSYVLRNGAYLATYQVKSTDTVVTEKPVDSTNTFINYEWGVSTAAIAGAKTFTVTKNFSVGDTINLCGTILYPLASSATSAGDFVIGSTIVNTVSSLVTEFNAEQAATPIYKATVPTTPDGTFTITEITAGGGNTPPDAVVTGSGAITSGTVTTSTAAIKGWVIDQQSSLDTLNAQYTSAKQQLHESHSAIMLAQALSKITSAEATTRIAALATRYDSLWSDIITKQEAIK